ncbi:MAG: 4-hydroxy-3-methylbut-2-enyl diphosphate reductase [Gammaproteobacteria bacterium]
MQVLLANPRGFCAGVDRAIEIVERALEKDGAPVYVRHEVVHNRVVVERLRKRGAVFVDRLDQIPPHATVIFSAHGVSREVRGGADARGLNVLDATCPLVTKVHIEVRQYRKRGLEVILIGHAGHPEVEGTMGQADDGIYLVENAADAARIAVRDPSRLAYVSQTTLSMDDTARIVAALRARFPKITGPKKNDICYATQNRQDAVKQLARECDIVFVVGSPNSSNSNRLREIAEACGAPAYLIDGPDEIRSGWLAGKKRAGVTAGASAPESLVAAVVARLSSGAAAVRELAGPLERVSFSLPARLRGG